MYLKRTLTSFGVFYRKNFIHHCIGCSFGSEKKGIYTMNIQNTNSASFITENKNRIFFLFILFVLSSLRMFGQTTTVQTVVVNNDEIVVATTQVETAVVSVDAQIDFVGWFMGSRQCHGNENETTDSKSSSTKKQILTSGITPNKVLYRTFMKRVISQDSAIV